jgi:hypothetical protein
MRVVYTYMYICTRYTIVVCVLFIFVFFISFFFFSSIFVPSCCTLYGRLACTSLFGNVLLRRCIHCVRRLPKERLVQAPSALGAVLHPYPQRMFTVKTGKVPNVVAQLQHTPRKPTRSAVVTHRIIFSCSSLGYRLIKTPKLETGV